MKKTIYFLTLTFLIVNLVSCEEEVKDPVSKVVFVSEGETVENGESEKAVEFICSEEWNAETDAAWITLPVKTGEKGKILLTYIIAQNTGGPRNGIITVKAKGGAEGKFTITQRAGEAPPTESSDLFVKVGGEGLGLSWEDATSLDYALSIVEHGDIIHIAEGTYIPTKMITNGDVDADKTFEINKNITLIGGYSASAAKGEGPDHTTYKTILSGDNKFYHVVAVTAGKTEGDAKVTLQGLTITKSKESTRAETGKVVIEEFTYDRGYGGGIIVGASNLEIIDCEIVDNMSGRAAAMYAASNATVRIERTKISRNIAEHHTGGFWASQGSKITIVDSEVTSNKCVGVGAGLYAFNGVEMNVYNTIVADNFGDNHGTGIYVRQNSKANIVNTIFANNSSPKGSGAIFSYDNSSISLISSTVTGNSMGTGGGFFAREGVNHAYIANSIISGNTATSSPDFGSYADGHLEHSLSGVIVGDITYDIAGNKVETAIFNYSNMLKGSDDWVYRLTGMDNPAMTNGLSATDLVEIGKTLDPIVDEETISQDLLYNSRSAVTIMGAVIE